MASESLTPILAAIQNWLPPQPVPTSTLLAFRSRLATMLAAANLAVLAEVSGLGPDPAALDTALASDTSKVVVLARKYAQLQSVKKVVDDLVEGNIARNPVEAHPPIESVLAVARQEVAALAQWEDEADTGITKIRKQLYGASDGDSSAAKKAPVKAKGKG